MCRYGRRSNPGRGNGVLPLHLIVRRVRVYNVTIGRVAGDRGWSRPGPGDEHAAGQGGREIDLRGHKRGGRQGDGGRDQQRPGGPGRGGRLLHDQRGRTGPGERAGQGRGGEMGPGGRADQQRGNRGQRTDNGLHRRSDTAHGRRQPGVALLGERIYILTHTDSTLN